MRKKAKRFEHPPSAEVNSVERFLAHYGPDWHLHSKFMRPWPRYLIRYKNK